MQPIELKYQFSDLGHTIFIMGIFAIIGLIPYASGLVGLINFIILIVLIAKVSRINRFINDKDLHDFRMRYIYSILMVIISFFIIILSLTFIFIFSWNLMIYNIFTFVITLIVIIDLIIGGMIFTIMFFEFRAWCSLNGFLLKNPFSFQESIKNDALEGTKFIKWSVLISFILQIALVIYVSVMIFYMILAMMGGGVITFSLFMIFEWSFNLIGALFGLAPGIVRALGLFKLSKLKNLTPPFQAVIVPDQAQYKPPNMADPLQTGDQIIQSRDAQGQQRVLKYCPFCGEEIVAQAAFCVNCGNKLPI